MAVAEADGVSPAARSFRGLATDRIRGSGRGKE